ncbi:protein O-mannosyl-transferase 2 isoform X6 [Odontomachus brunneus]|uniref:protein O-mannosyl-transferase 2 isoform X6 n=1 Tax=Odontomachus brunneus TaxID=486640 RepID=UPI0013F23153|nr:protein O-mannosyl-transferase 2 isoform X6 [Odontomachus brunneus]
MKNVSNIEKITCSSKNMMTSQVNKKEENVTNWWLLLGCITMLTLLTRFYKVTEPQHVCWDETHFGKMGNWYINRTFFFDVHPPLGKMLIALSGYITGYDGTFAFEKPGDKFENVNYIGMRIFCTSLGASIVPLSYLIVWDLTKSTRASSLAAIFILFDVGLLTLNQYILLDPILLCFMMCATWGMVRVASLRNQPFTCSWWLWLSFTGASLACTISVKFVGLFVVLLVGLYTVHELWRELGDLSNSIITTYSHKDDNNLWLVKKFDSDEMPSEAMLVKHGDLIRLEHVITRRNLHSHKEIAPISKKHYQVTGYGENGTGDANDVWKILITNGKDGDVVETVTSKLKFIHYLHHCVLTCNGKTLPKWGYNQQEVSCNPNMRDKNALWNIEDNQYAKLPNVSFQVYAPGFIDRFLESHAVMLQGNSDLKVKEGEVSSRPWQWPINYRGQFFSGNNQRIYLLGNPIIWWGNIVFLIVFIILYAYAAVREQRGCVDDIVLVEQRSRITHAGKWIFLGWILHYAPFWAMSRVLYFHHYFPALLFSSMLTGVTLNHIIDSLLLLLPGKVGNTVYHVILGTVISGTAYRLQLPDVDIFIEIYSWCMLEFLNFIKMLRWQLICLAPCAQGSESLSISSRISALESVSSTRLRQIHRRGIWIFLASLFLFRPSAFPPWITVGEVLPVMYATLNLLIWVMGNLSVGLPVVARGVDRTSRLFPYSARLLRSSPTRGSRHRHPQRYASSIAQVTPLGGTFIAAGPKCTAALA